MDDPIVQVSGFGVENTPSTQCNYMLVALTKSGRVLMSMGDREWADVSPRTLAQSGERKEPARVVVEQIADCLIERGYENIPIEGADEDGEEMHPVDVLSEWIDEQIKGGEPGWIPEEWRPIDTAPKGGGADLVSDPNWVEPPRILLWFPNERKMICGYWDWYYAEGGWGHKETGGCAWVGNDSYEPLVLSYGPPTHWRELPAAPEPDADERE